MSLTEKIMKKLKQDVESLELIPASGGLFEVEKDGKLIFSKKKEGRFPEWKEIEPKLK